jgi:MinD-like ATPase involved in chromosome partitioning or flagellar assembly
VWEVREEEPSLEEAFFELTGDADGTGSTASRERDGDADRDADDGEQDDESGGDAEAERDAATEEALDRDLGALRGGTYAGVVAVLGSAGGVGRTTLSFLLGDVLAGHTQARVIVIALSLDRERLATPIPADRRSALSATELLQDVEGFDAAARISPYVSVGHSGLSTVQGPRRPAPLEELTPQRLEALLAFARRFYEVVILDVGELPETPLHEVVRRADEVVLISSARADAAEQAVSPVLKVVEAERSERATLLLNRVDPERARAFGEQRGGGVHGLVPDDRELIRALDLGDFRIEKVQASTRIALKRAALTVAEGLQ